MRKSIALSLIGIMIVAAWLLLPTSVRPAAASSFPQTIALPNGWRPEGIVVGRGTTIYSGSLATGAIYQADLRTGQGSVLVGPQQGRVAVGLDFDARTNYLYVAGGPTGAAYVYDAASGATIGAFQLTTEASTFINDAIVTRQAVYFTDSFNPLLYRIVLLPGGALSSTVETIPLGGDFQFVAGQFNANGIEATPDGSGLIVVNSSLGTLYLVDPLTGLATFIDIGDMTVAGGDGILLTGQTLYIVQGLANQVAVIDMDSDFTSGTITGIVTDSRFDIPTTIDAFSGALYAVNARFTTPPTPETSYTIERLF